MEPQLVNVKDVREDMLETAQKSRWASPSDWEGQKQRIVYLYTSLDYPLWKVMRIMRATHGFLATQKMYKYNLRKWGVRKSLRATQDLLQQVHAEDGKPSKTFIRGFRLDQKELEAFLKRVSRSHSDHVGGSDTLQLAVLGDTASRRTPPLEQTSLQSFQPGVEKILHATRSYVSSSFDSGRWTKSHIPWRNDLATSAHNGAYSASRLMCSGHIAQAFRILNICMDSCRDVLSSQTPFFFHPGMYAVLFQFSKQNETLSRSIFSFLRDMAFVIHRSKLHPVYVLFDSMSRMTTQQLHQCAWALVDVYHASMSTELGTGSAFAAEMSTMYGRGISWVAACTLAADCTVERSLQEHVRVLSAGRQGATFEVMEAKMRLANFFLDRRRYSEARSAAEEVISLDRGEGAGAKNAYLIDDCHRVLFWVSRAEGSREETARAAGRWVEYSTTQLGRSHELAVDALGEVAEYFREVGDPDTASKARRDHEMAIDDMCERLERVGLDADGCSAPKKTMLFGRTSQKGSTSP